MKTKYFLFIAAAVSSLTACQKDFDPASYAPPLNISGYTASSQIAPSNLVAHWSFDGNLIDSVSKTAGTNKGTSIDAGIKKQAFQGALNSYVLTQPSAKVKSLQSFTLTEWINTPPPSSGILGVFSLSNTTQFWGNLEIFIENGSTNEDGKLRIHINKNGDKTYALDKVAGLFNKWIALAVSYDATTSTVKVYVNGSRVGAGTVTGLTGPLAWTDTGNVVFGTVQFQTSPSQTSGASAQGWASFLTGKIDEVRLYDKALSDIEVSSLVKLEGRGK
ncbi:LamG domain-containing protein [Pedobacter xixiisoli]|uniref:Concanavalin A-like lectin/glucanases superfamily protein n=1 Tax=Pedobacter xixiisoli TaxID=1476464 RepID=A0A286AAN1_9SPHI|nr:LamG domain-containing protein [Pedobacter xixiisoli]SOD18887.1 Concanavalin A-like lectin/glucanases superfamily protein [Pedobacter xixiisoli]